MRRRVYAVHVLHRVSSAKDVRLDVELADSSFHDKWSLATALRDLGLLGPVVEISEYRTEGSSVLIFPQETGSVWHCITLTLKGELSCSDVVFGDPSIGEYGMFSSGWWTRWSEQRSGIGLEPLPPYEIPPGDADLWECGVNLGIRPAPPPGPPTPRKPQLWETRCVQCQLAPRNEVSKYCDGCACTWCRRRQRTGNKEGTCHGCAMRRAQIQTPAMALSLRQRPGRRASGTPPCGGRATRRGPHEKEMAMTFGAVKTLHELRRGALFKTEDGRIAVKYEYKFARGRWLCIETVFTGRGDGLLLSPSTIVQEIHPW